MHKGGSVYILSSPNKVVLYIGVTSDLPNRILQHQNKIHIDSFTSKYNCVVLVYYKHFEYIQDAIAEEKRLKGYNRKYKEELINSVNPNWIDLSKELK